MYFNGPITFHYLQDGVDIYQYETEVKGHIELPRTLLHSSIPCHVYTLSNSKINMILGVTNIGNYKVLLPLKYNEVDIVVKVNYIMTWVDSGITRKLQVANVRKYVSHIEAEVVSLDV